MAIAVVHADGRELAGFGLEAADVGGVEQVGKNQVALDLDMANALAEGEGGPVARVDARRRGVDRHPVCSPGW